MTATTSEVLAATNLTHRKLDWWVRQGYLQPDREQDGSGSGYDRLWPQAEVEVVQLMARLVNVGLLPSAASVYARHLIALRRAGQPACIEIGDESGLVLEFAATGPALTEEDRFDIEMDARYEAARDD